MQAGSRHSAAVNLHGIEQGDWSNLPGTARCPLDGTEDGFRHIVLKLERYAIPAMMPCPSQRLRERNAVIAQHDPINRQLFDAGYRF